LEEVTENYTVPGKVADSYSKFPTLDELNAENLKVRKPLN
jgi:hypothetical protein